MSLNPQHDQPLHPGGPMSVEEYLLLDRIATNAKYEYLDDAARLMSGGSVAHDRIARNIAHAMDDQFVSGPCTAFGSDVQAFVGIKPSGKERYVYPDATVSCDVSDRVRDNKLIRSPRIVFEVLSPSTEPLDRGTKLKTYQKCPTIQEIVLVSQFAQRVEIYLRKDDDTWSYTAYDAEENVELTSVDVTLTMAEIYKGINFNEPLAGK